MQLSLLVPYRDRPNHLVSQLRWWQNWQTQTTARIEYLLIDYRSSESASAPASPSPTSREIETLVRDAGGRYVSRLGSGAFPKTQLLNLGLSLAQGQWIAPLDVDLIPLGDTLQRHLALAQSFGLGLVTGYRLMSPLESLPPGDYDAAIAIALNQATLGPEDQPSALWKHLTQGERFGVLPLFERDRLRSLGGWDERFVGWGAEDQDLLERYLQNTNHLNTAHLNTAHLNTAHLNTAHLNTAHLNTAHLNTAHLNTAHLNTAHLNTFIPSAPSLTPGSRSLCRCPDLVYLHLHHEPSPNWAEPLWVERNRAHYYAKRSPL